MNSCASGLGERLFKVMTEIGIRVLGNASGSALSTACLRGKLMMLLSHYVRLGYARL
jgi:hypothetical protein